LPDSNKQPILPLEPDPEMVGRHSYRNPNCHLAVRGAKPYRRCNHCRLHTRQCLGIQNLGIAFLIGLLLLLFPLLDHGMLERANIVAIVSLLFVLSYRINTNLDSLSKSDLTNTELNLRLREHTENLERRILSRTEELKKLATTDTLTGLVNRGEFENQLGELVDRANEQDQVHAMCFMDLDQFKIINDVCGHVAGDELLRQIRPLLEAHVRDSDIVARFGGDEFAILFPFCDVGHAAEIAEHIRESIDGFRFFWEGSSYAIGVSMGVVGISRGSGTVATTLAAADAACYRAKELGRNRICLHEPDAEDVDAHHIQMRWSTRITDALDRHRLRLSFQEIVPARDTVDTRPHYEVLVRMEDDNGGEIPPMAFLPAAERYNLITKIDFWVINEALRACALLHELQPTLLSINLSGTSLGDDNLLDYVGRKLEQWKVDPSLLVFEITETAAISRLNRSSALMASLQSRGCRFALDDFGSGLASFGYLKHLPVDFLKIDGSFVRNVLADSSDRSLVEIINHIGHMQNKETVAEFVDSPEIADAMREIGVDYLQGYSIGRPRTLLELMDQPRYREARVVGDRRV